MMSLYSLSEKIKDTYPNLYHYCKTWFKDKETKSFCEIKEIPKKIKTHQLTLDNCLSTRYQLERSLKFKKIRNQKKQQVQHRWKSELKPAEDKVLEDILDLEEKKFSFLKQNVLNFNTNNAMERLVKYLEKKLVLGTSLGIQGAGKTTFYKKHIPEKMYLSIDDEAKRFGTYCVKGRKLLGEHTKRLVTYNLVNNRSIIVDGFNLYKESREFTRERAEKYNAELFCFLFYSSPDICFERIEKRKRLNMSMKERLTNIIKYLIEVELPINKDFSIEKGIDLLFIINEKGQLTSVYPLKKFKKIFYGNY